MKKSVFLFSAIAMAAFASCEKKTETTIESKDTTVVVTPPPPAVETPDSTQDTSSTAVKVTGKDSVKVEVKK